MEEELIEAVKNNDIEEVKSLLERGLQPDFTGEYNFNGYEKFLLRYVVECDNLEMLKLLLDNGGREYINYEYPRVPGTPKETLLHKAAAHGNVEIVKLLLDYGADVNARNEHGETPLFDTMYIDHSDGYNDKYDQVVDLLLKYGADINAVNNEGNTPILAASSTDILDNARIEKLFNIGVDVNISNNKGENLLMLCFYYPEDEFFEYSALIKQSTIETINAQDINGRTPLMRAIIDAVENDNAEDAGVMEFIEELLNAGADINIVDNNGYDALWYAVSRNKIGIIQALINHGVKLDLNDENINRTLSNAVLNLNSGIIECLKNNSIFFDIFNRIDFDNEENKQNLYNSLLANGVCVAINDISNANKNFMIKAINIANTSFGENFIFNLDSRSLMIDFINSGIVRSRKSNLIQEERDNLKNVMRRFDSAVINRNGEEIKNTINDLFILCKTNKNIYDIIDCVIDKDIIYRGSNISLTKLLNFYGFNTESFCMGMRTNQILTNGIGGVSVLNHKMNGDKAEMSIINKYFDLVFSIVLDESFDALSQNKDINNACFLYQEHPTEENKNNLINTIINNSNYETKDSLLFYLTKFEAKVNRPGERYRVAKLETLFNGIGISDFGTCLKTRLQAELQLNNLANANNALNNNQNQIE